MEHLGFVQVRQSGSHVILKKQLVEEGEEQKVIEVGCVNLMQIDAIELQVDAIELQVDAIELQVDAIELQADAIELQVDAIELSADAIELQEIAFR
ncbi:type II toxin-antitoxin system HicA family toxin [Nostoc sp. UHCC 0251]|nr:type II toxin-antitoxin system HicA family toxin [Nostoc sp. UHCC 0251]MEA5623275.1 type II toxin-antitoxin system HicA family toxin [Nostoc sp. UHCC 0251]